MLQKLSDQVSDCLDRAAAARRRADQATDARHRADYLSIEHHWNTLARSLEFADRVDRFLYGGAEGRDGWKPISSAPFGDRLELAVANGGGIHALVFPCRRTEDGWVDARSGRRIDAAPTHWREWLDLGPPAAQVREQRRNGGPDEGRLVVFQDERTTLSVERGDDGSFELNFRMHGEEVTAYDLDRDTLAMIGRRLLSLAARSSLSAPPVS